MRQILNFCCLSLWFWLSSFIYSFVEVGAFLSVTVTYFKASQGNYKFPLNSDSNVFLWYPRKHSCHLSTSWLGSKQTSAEQIHIHSGNVTSFAVSVRSSSQRTVNCVKNHGNRANKDQESDSCGNAITFNKKRKLNTQKEQPSVKKTSRPTVPQRWYYKSRLTLSLGWTKILKKLLLVACKGNQTLRLVWANQAVSGRQWSQVEEPDLRTAFTEPEVEEFCSFSSHQSKGTWEEMWEEGGWWWWWWRGQMRRGQGEEK